MSSEWKTSLLGETVLSGSGAMKSVDLEVKGDDVLGLYFSAHWCPPCRGFTPKLAEFYNKVNGKGGKKFQVVFVSADRAVDQFNSYFGDMPWHALPYDQKEKNEELSDLCKVNGIPKLVLFDSSGEVIKMKSDARTMVMTDPEGNGFPWAV